MSASGGAVVAAARTRWGTRRLDEQLPVVGISYCSPFRPSMVYVVVSLITGIPPWDAGLGSPGATDIRGFLLGRRLAGRVHRPAGRQWVCTWPGLVTAPRSPASRASQRAVTSIGPVAWSSIGWCRGAWAARRCGGRSPRPPCTGRGGRATAGPQPSTRRVPSASAPRLLRLPPRSCFSCCQAALVVVTSLQEDREEVVGGGLPVEELDVSRRRLRMTVSGLCLRGRGGRRTGW
jgi:hypothetical protein